MQQKETVISLIKIKKAIICLDQKRLYNNYLVLIPLWATKSLYNLQKRKGRLEENSLSKINFQPKGVLWLNQVILHLQNLTIKKNSSNIFVYLFLFTRIRWRRWKEHSNHQ